MQPILSETVNYCQLMDKRNLPAVPALPLTDQLAIGRNKLANERTLLAYIRTFLSFAVAGASLIQFFDVRFFIVLGYFFMPFGAIILIIGFMRYIKTRTQLNSDKAA